VSSDTIVVSREGYAWSLNRLIAQKHLEGKIQGARDAAVWLKKKAVEAFAEERDEDAILLRKLSKKLAESLVIELDKAAQDHDKDYPSSMSSARGEADLRYLASEIMGFTKDPNPSPATRALRAAAEAWLLQNPSPEPASSATDATASRRL
jgi:hypothetical protein